MKLNIAKATIPATTEKMIASGVRVMKITSGIAKNMKPRKVANMELRNVDLSPTISLEAR